MSLPRTTVFVELFLINVHLCLGSRLRLQFTHKSYGLSDIARYAAMAQGEEWRLLGCCSVWLL
jgi:hypothetical protein